MTSSAALDKEPSSFSSLPHTLTQDSKNVPAVPSSEKNMKIWNVKKKKRQLPVISIPATKQAKKIRTAVTRTHSPRPVTPAITAPAWLSRVEKITPTIPGIENAAQHLFNTKARLPMTSSPCDAHTFLALPTECTYEVCALLSWDKDEKITGEESALREDQLDRLKIIASAPSVHIYLQHQNIKQMDKLLDFPKKAYATIQNPNVRCTFNESKYLFQKLADHFWPGPVHIYLSPQSFAPDGLLRANFCTKKYIGFRCPSHPLAVKILKRVYQNSLEPVILAGSPILHEGIKITRAKGVASKLFQLPEVHLDSKVQILHGEERREIFTVPTCQFQDEWLELWIVPEKRTIVLKGKSKRDVIPQMKEVLRNTSEQNRIICSVLQHWKVADHREQVPGTVAPS